MYIPTPSSASVSPITPRSSCIGSTVGATLGGVAAFVIIAAVGLCWLRKEHRQRNMLVDKAEHDEKAQLHSNDLEPVTQEMEADRPTMKADYTELMVEMAANTEVSRRNELAANEIVGSEMAASTKHLSAKG